MELGMKQSIDVNRYRSRSTDIIWFMFLKIHAGYFMVKGKKVFSMRFLDGGGVQF